VLADRAVVPPFGVGGGGAAAPVHVSLVHDGQERDFATPGKVTNQPIVAGDVVIMRSAGGGGYGDPLTRDPERVRADVAAGHVSRDRARDGYGVVLGGDGTVDDAATASLRASLAAARCRVTIVADDRDPYAGLKGRHRRFRVAPALAASLGLEAADLVELRGRHPAPLRGWITLDRAAALDAIGLDAFGRAVLGVESGETVEVRRLEMPPIPGGMAT
jgi:N-methylhydantoinase B